MDKRLRWLNNLLCFEVAARNQSYSKAAEELFISQAAVSQQMRQLENNLGITLFTRKSRQMMLTPPGKTLLKACQAGFSEVLSGLNQVQEEPVDGDLTVSSTQAFCALWLVPRLFGFSKHHPSININVLGSNRVEDLQNGNVDVAIRFSTSSAELQHPSLVVEKIGEDEVFPVCSPALLEQSKLDEPCDFLSVRLLGLACEEKVNWETWFEHAGVDWMNAKLQKTEVTSSDLALSAALSGHGVMLASDIMVGDYLKTGQLVVPIDLPHPVRWKSHLVYLQNTSKKNRIEQFCEWVKSEIQHQAS